MESGKMSDDGKVNGLFLLLSHLLSSLVNRKIRVYVDSFFYHVN